MKYIGILLHCHKLKPITYFTVLQKILWVTFYSIFVITATTTSLSEGHRTRECLHYYRVIHLFIHPLIFQKSIRTYCIIYQVLGWGLKTEPWPTTDPSLKVLTNHCKAWYSNIFPFWSIGKLPLYKMVLENPIYGTRVFIQVGKNGWWRDNF